MRPMNFAAPEPGPAAVPLSEVLGALSHALDITEGQPPGHCVRCAFLGVRVGRALGFDERTLRDLAYTLLLKDLGCSSNAARICELYLTDDRVFKRDYKRVSGGLPQAIRFVVSHTGLRSGLAERFRSLVQVLQNGGSIARELIETRCQRGAAIALRLRFPERVAEGIRSLDEHWDGGGRPEGLAGEAIPLFARIALMAQVVDVFLTADGPDAARREMRARSGDWFDPAVVGAFEAVAAERDFFALMRTADIATVVEELGPAVTNEVADDDYLDDIAAAFAEIVDSKSPYTRGHSERVAVYTDLVAEEMGLSDGERRRLKRAALLHDIGKLGVSNAVLDKPGRLDEDEWGEMRAHALHSEEILARIGAFSELARIGGAHHEKLDGTGYPRGLSGEAICPATRIVSTADVFDALTADRPYRAAMPVEEALAILRKDVGRALDGDCVAAMERAVRRAGLADAA